MMIDFFRKLGDRLLASKSDSTDYPNPQNVTLNLSYPASGEGGVITYVQFDVQQVSTFVT